MCSRRFALSQLGTWPTAGYWYQAVNLVSGLGLMVAGIATGQWGFVTLNAAWSLIGAHGLIAHRDERPPDFPK